MLGDRGGRVLPIFLRILLGSTSDNNLSWLINLFAFDRKATNIQAALTQLAILASCSAATPPLCLCQSRVVDEPNKQSDEAHAPCIAQPGIAHKPTVEEWEQVSQGEKDRLIAAARLTLLELISTATEAEDRKRYFAKPGEAEWGCRYSGKQGFVKAAAGLRTVFLTNYCSDVMRTWKSLCGPGFSDFVFANPNSPLSHIKDYTRQWQAIAKKAGVTGHRMYDTRSTFATRVNACTQSILTVAQLLGHKGTSVSVLPAYMSDRWTKIRVRS
jgi:hypothetical protein